MKGKKIIPILIMLFIIVFTVGVNASEYWNAYSTIEKSEDSGELYNLMPTEVKKGDIISVKVIAKNAKGWEISYVGNELKWDSQAFEIVETNGEYYRLLGDNYSCSAIVIDKGSLRYNCDFDNYVASSDNEEFLEFKFKVKKDVSDDVYKIYQRYSEYGLALIVNNESEYVGSSWAELYYQVGKPKLVSDYTNDKIGNSTYIIGNHMFTRDGSDEYSGTLTTDYIMLASKTIESDNKDDMIVYLKNAKGVWKNAITDEPITPPDEFKIVFQNMKGTYKENGIYSDSNDKNILRLVQLSKEKAVITIENDKEKVNGIAEVNGNIATLNVSGKSYKITISGNEVNIETSDDYIGNKRLQKRANYTISDLYDNLVGLMYEESYPKMYLNSGHSGKYTNGNYELYIARVRDDAARMCIKEKGKEKCIFNTTMWSNKGGWYLNGEETTYGFSSDETGYGVNWLTDKLEVKCAGACESNPYVGTYQKEKSLTMEEAIEAWVNNERYYKVVFNSNNEENDYLYNEYVLENDTIEYSPWPSKDGHDFIGWYLNNTEFDFDTPITKPITLMAMYEVITLPTPVLSIYSQNYDNNNSIQYSLKVESDKYFDGFEVYQKDGPNEPVGFGSSGYSGIIVREVAKNSESTYYAQTYLYSNGGKIYSEKSNEIILAPVTHIVSFDTDGGTVVVNYEAIDGEIIRKPANPTKEGYTFVEWQLNGQTYTFDTPVTSDITLKAFYTQNALSHEVIFNTDGGTMVTNQVIEHGKKIAVIPNDPTKDGNTFVGWYLNNEPFDFDTPITSDITLVAMWNATSQYTVTFNSDGGSSVASQTVNSGGKATKPTDPTKDKYVFIRWQLNNEPFDFDTPITGNITLKAVWEYNTYGFDITTKQGLRDLYAKEVNDKDYSPLVKEFLMDTYDVLYANYPTWRNAYKDLPGVKTYVFENLIKVIPDIESIDLYLKGTEEANEVGLGYTSATEDGKLYIKLVYDSYTNRDDEAHLYNIEALFHEIIHCKQSSEFNNNIVNYIEGKNYSDYRLLSMLIEGGATFHQKFITKYTEEMTQSLLVGLEDKSKIFTYSSGAAHYSKYANFYEVLYYILGYGNINNMELGITNLFSISDMLTNKVGEDILYYMANSASIDRSYDNTNFEYASKVDKLLLKAVKNDISNLNNVNDIQKFIDVYRNIKSKVLPIVSYGEDTASFAYDNKAEEYFILDEIENLFVNKILSVNLLPQLSNNSSLNKMAIKSILKSNRLPYRNSTGNYYIRLPYYIEDAVYNYFEENGKGHLVLKYSYANTCLPYSDNIAYLEFTFDENSILSINELDAELRESIQVYNKLYSDLIVPTE